LNLSETLNPKQSEFTNQTIGGLKVTVSQKAIKSIDYAELKNHQKLNLMRKLPF
jgi:hypothetical protein